MEYEFVQLGSVCTFENGDRGKNYPNEKDFTETGIPFVNGGHIINGKIDISQLNYISEQKYSQLRAGKASRGDILFSLRGSLGKCVRNPFEKAAIASALVIVRPNEKIDRDYLFYVMNSPFFVKQGENNDNGSVQINLSVDILKSFSIPLPSMEKQKKIAFFLDSIDKKIDNNNVIAAELEGMAKDLYDYWFVQFDFPDENGKPYKSSGGKMVWNEKLKRKIPEGWEVDRLGRHITSSRGISYNSATLEGDGIPMINLASFGVDSNYKPAGIKTYNGQYDADKILHPFDLIMCNTQQTAIDQTKDIIGKAMLVPDIFDGDVVSSHHVTTITPDVDELKYYLYGTCKTTWFHKYIVGFASGTNILGLDFKGFEDYLMPLPPMRLLKKFATAMKNIESEKNLIITENAELASLRDFLLPMLMNGQVKVKGVS
mgnify:CR=1 FL=1